MKPMVLRKRFGQEFLMALQMGLTLAVAIPLVLWFWRANAAGLIPSPELLPRGVYKWGPWHFSDKRVTLDWGLTILFYLPILSAVLGVTSAVLHYKQDETGRIFGRWTAVVLAQFAIFLYCFCTMAWLTW
jgi:hypothetical protein